MLPQTDTPGSWKFVRRKASSLVRTSPLIYTFLLGFGLGLIYFGTNRPVADSIRLPGDTSSNGKAKISVTSGLPSAALSNQKNVASRAQADTSGTSQATTSAATSTSSSATPQLTRRPGRPPLMVGGVEHPHSAAAHMWRNIAHNASVLQGDGAAKRNKKRSQVALFVMVKSAPAYKERRSLCRNHWQWRGVDKSTFIPGLVDQKFLIGQADNDATNQAIRDENEKFGDILIYPGNDTYRRLPWKVLWGMQFVSEHYNYDMLLLMDDDSFVNYPMALRWTASQLAERIYAGQLVGMNPKVQRNPKDQWFVPPSVYEPNEYPPYHWGAGYFLSADLVAAILQESTHHEVLWIDDAFMAILLNATHLPINLQDINVYAVPDWAIFLCCEPSPLVLGSRNPKKMARVGALQKKMSPLCRVRRSKNCKRPKSI